MLLRNLLSCADAATCSRWDAAVGNMEDARVAFDALAKAVDDGLYLDEDAFNAVQPIHQYTTRIQVCAGSNPASATRCCPPYTGLFPSMR